MLTFVMVLTLMPLAIPARADAPMIYAQQELAINGYDVVAYFVDGHPVPGSDNHVIHWKGAIWRFASAEHLALFEANPYAYAPQFGGYCAYGVALGKTSAGDPAAWIIHDGKLYIASSPAIRDRWVQRVNELAQQGHANWPAVLRK